MPGLTFQQMQDRVYAVLRDPNKVYFTAAEVKDWLNEAQADLAARLRVLQATATGTTDGTATITLPSDYVDHRLLELGGEPVVFVDDRTFEDARDTGANLSTTIARVYTEKIELYPVPASGTSYELRYYKLPGDLVNGSDVSPLPPELHVKMVRYAQAQAKLKAGEEGAADRYLAMYEQGLPGPAVGRQRFWPGPLSVFPDPGPIDRDPQSIHI